MELELINKDSEFYCTSLQISEYFDKRHDNIIRDIRNIIKEVPEEFSFLNYEESEYVDSRGKVQTMYLLTKDGFVFICMGFTGEKANTMKLYFIEKFNAMERLINETTKAIYQTPEQKAFTIIETYNKLADIFQCPKHVALHEGVKQARLQTNVDCLPLLISSPINDVVDSMWLEPTELGAIHGVSAMEVNGFLERNGYQIKENKQWKATSNASNNWQLHAWQKSNKSGYNIKWNSKWFKSIYTK